MMTCLSACRKRCNYCTCSWKGCEFISGFEYFLYERISRIRDTRSPSVTHESYVLSIFEHIKDFVSFCLTGVRVIAESWSSDFVVSQKYSCRASILTGDIINLFKSTDSSESDIFKISDGSWDDGKHSFLILHRIPTRGIPTKYL